MVNRGGRSGRPALLAAVVQLSARIVADESVVYTV
jgi:hypothetical protein